MRLPTLLRKRGAPTQIGGQVRLDRRTKNLTKRLRPGEIAVIHHSDLDRVSAEHFHPECLRPPRYGFSDTPDANHAECAFFQ
jgi:uncharacterized membrane-anchored protein